MRHRFSTLVFIFALLALPVFGQTPRPRVAVVLSGGGAKGMAHIGVLKVLERAGIPVDIVTGTSMGSIVGGLYSCGWSADQLDSLVRRQDWPFLLSDRQEYYTQDLEGRRLQTTYFLTKAFTLSHHRLQGASGLIEGKNLQRLFTHLTAGYNDSISFDSLPIPFACVATNIVDNTEYDFHSGVLAEAMRTSMSIPGAFSPIRMGDKVLVDGGLRNNYPADIARQMGADYIIGATVQGPPKTADDLANGASVLGQIVDVNCKNKYDANLAITDIAIRVDTRGYNAASFTPAAIDTLIRRGEEEAMRHWPELMALRDKLGLADNYRPRPLHPQAKALTPVDFSAHNDERATSGGNDIIQGSLGIRFDTEEKVAMQLAGTWLSGKKPWRVDVMARLGRNYKAMASLGWRMPHGRLAALAYTYAYHDLDIYREGEKYYSSTYSHHQAKLSLMGINMRNITLDISARFDYYDPHTLLFAQPMESNEVKTDDHFISYHAALHYNSENTGLFPTRGAMFLARYAYYTDNFTGYNGHKGFSEVTGSWRKSFALTSHLTLQPMVYGRLLFGSDIPSVRRNVIGGPWFGHYLDQQLPMVGMHHLELTDNHFVAGQAQLQQQLTTNNFIILRGAWAWHDDRLADVFSHRGDWSCQAAYFYRTLLGPLGIMAGYSSEQKDFRLMATMGYEF